MTSFSAASPTPSSPGRREGIFEQYVPGGAETIPAAFRDPEGYWTGVAMNPIRFMFNRPFLEKMLLSRPHRGRICSTRLSQRTDHGGREDVGDGGLPPLQPCACDGENEAFAYQKKLDENMQQYTKSGAAARFLSEEARRREAFFPCGRA